MPNYPKIVVMLKKEFPEITSEEIDEMISKIPPNFPTVAVMSLIKLTKACYKNPELAKRLKKEKEENECIPQQQECVPEEGASVFYNNLLQ